MNDPGNIEKKQNIQNINNRSYYKRATETANNYLSDEALESLISVVEAEPLLRPPKEFKHDLIDQIRLKSKRRKDRQLFLYSMKVIAATAAALGMILIVPENILPEENSRNAQIQEHLDDAAKEQMWQDEADQNRSSWEMEADYEDSLNNRINSRLNAYCRKLNDDLSKLVRMEVFE